MYMVRFFESCSHTFEVAGRLPVKLVKTYRKHARIGLGGCKLEDYRLYRTQKKGVSKTKEANVPPSEGEDHLACLFVCLFVCLIVLMNQTRHRIIIKPHTHLLYTFFFKYREQIFSAVDQHKTITTQNRARGL